MCAENKLTFYYVTDWELNSLVLSFFDAVLCWKCLVIWIVNTFKCISVNLKSLTNKFTRMLCFCYSCYCCVQDNVMSSFARGLRFWGISIFFGAAMLFNVHTCVQICICRHTTCCRSGGSHMHHRHCSTAVHLVLSCQGLLVRLLCLSTDLFILKITVNNNTGSFVFETQCSCLA